MERAKISCSFHELSRNDESGQIAHLIGAMEHNRAQNIPRFAFCEIVYDGGDVASAHCTAYPSACPDVAVITVEYRLRSDDCLYGAYVFSRETGEYALRMLSTETCGRPEYAICNLMPPLTRRFGSHREQVGALTMLLVELNRQIIDPYYADAGDWETLQRRLA